MNCEWEQIGIHEATGWRHVRCKWCCTQAVSPYPNERIYCDCARWPFWWEFGEWLAILLAALGITARRYGWLRWKLGLDEPGSCGSCDARKLWLNTFGGRLATSTHWAAKWLAGRLVRRR